MGQCERGSALSWSYYLVARRLLRGRQVPRWRERPMDELLSPLAAEGPCISSAVPCRADRLAGVGPQPSQPDHAVRKHRYTGIYGASGDVRDRLRLKDAAHRLR